MGYVRSRFCSLALMAALLLTTCTVFYHGLPAHKDISARDIELQATIQSYTVVVDEEKITGALQQEMGWVQRTREELEAEEAAAKHDLEKMEEEDRKRKKKQEETNKRKKAAEERNKKAKQEEQRRLQEEKKKKDDPSKKNKVVVPIFNTTTATPHDTLEPSQIVILTASDGKGHNGAIPDIFTTTAANRAAYAARHGYHSHFLNISEFNLHGAHPVWAKLPAIASTFNSFPDAEWIWWLDLDALIMTPSIELTSHLLLPGALDGKLLTSEKLRKVTPKDAPEWENIRTPATYNPSSVDMIITQDHNGPNAGSFFIRRSEWTRSFMDAWADPLYIEKNWIGQEQDAIVHMLRNYPSTREHIGFVNQALINAYPGFGRGQLVTHFAGCWVLNECKQRWKETLEIIKKTEKEEADKASAQEGEAKKI